MSSIFETILSNGNVSDEQTLQKLEKIQKTRRSSTQTEIVLKLLNKIVEKPITEDLVREKVFDKVLKLKNSRNPPDHRKLAERKRKRKLKNLKIKQKRKHFRLKKIIPNKELFLKYHELWLK